MQGASSLPLLVSHRFSPSTFATKKKNKKTFPKGDKLCLVDKKAAERDLSYQRKAHLRTLFKCTSVDRMSAYDPRNFSTAPGVFSLGEFQIVASLDGE